MVDAVSERADEEEIGTILRPRRAAQEAPAALSPTRPARQPSAAASRPTRGVPFASDLDLNAAVPHRAVPMLGDWGPGDVPSTREKKRARWVVPVAFVAVIGVVAFVWYQFFLMLG